MSGNKKIVTIGGGGGHTQVLLALRDIPNITITGICPSTDSGGSTGILQKEYGGNGYIGDLTKCIVALCKDKAIAKAFSHRYEKGQLDGHSVKNLLFLALEKTSGLDDALKTIWNICGLGEHRVLPVSSEKAELCAKLDIGNNIFGETNIDTIAQNPLWNPTVHSISEIYLNPKINASPLATTAIKDSDCVVVCPGDLYTSIVATLLPEGMKEAIGKTNAKIILILNIMTKKGETDGYTAADMADKIEENLGRKADYIICNNAAIPEEILLKYSLENKVELGALDGSNDPRIKYVPLAMVGDDERVYSDPEVIRRAISEIMKD